jgi:hypothetical protein
VLFTVFDVPATFVESKIEWNWNKESYSYHQTNKNISQVFNVLSVTEHKHHLKLLCDRFELYGDLSVDGSFNPTGVREFL